jgi:PBSX family phage terminase large subunit
MTEFKKTTKQVEAIKLLGSKAKDIMLFGGSRSGKTFILIYAIIVRACKVKSRHCILRFKFNHAKRSIWLDTLPKVISIAFPNLGVTSKSYNKSDYYLTLPNGSEIWVGGLDDKERVEKILGNEYSTVYFNESSQINYSSIQTAKTRLAEKNDLVKRALYDCNPPSKRHWAYWLFVKKVNPVESEPIKNPDRYNSLLMNPKDNLENIDDEYLELLEAMPEKERNRFLLGLFSDADDGLAYYAFDPEKHVKETYQTHGTLFLGFDFNVMPMTAVVFQIIDDTVMVHDEAFLENSDTYKMADYLIKKNYIGDVIPDSTGRNRKTSGKSDHEILRESGFNVLPTHNPFVTDRVNNVNRLFTNNQIIINPKCKKLINDLNKVSWKDNKLDQKTDPMLTHISDALGYGCYKLMPLIKRKPSRTIIL